MHSRLFKVLNSIILGNGGNEFTTMLVNSKNMRKVSEERALRNPSDFVEFFLGQGRQRLLTTIEDLQQSEAKVCCV
jgi:hypothetical protein